MRAASLPITVATLSCLVVRVALALIAKTFGVGEPQSAFRGAPPQ